MLGPFLRTGIGTDTLGPTSILSLYLGPPLAIQILMNKYIKFALHYFEHFPDQNKNI